MDSQLFFLRNFYSLKYFRFMKNFLQKYFGYLGLVIYGIIAVAIRIPAFVTLFVFIVIYMLIIAPILGTDDSPKWAVDLYNWYCGR